MSEPEENDERFGLCFQCEDTPNCEACIGPPCECECPWPNEREIARRIADGDARAVAISKLTEDERRMLGVRH